MLANDQIVSPDIIVYEVCNSIWKHEHLLKDLKDGEPYLAVLFGLIEAGRITVLSPNEKLMKEAYSIAKRNGITVYDAIFISLAIKLGVALKSHDKFQIRAFKSEMKTETQ